MKKSKKQPPPMVASQSFKKVAKADHPSKHEGKGPVAKESAEKACQCSPNPEGHQGHQR